MRHYCCVTALSLLSHSVVDAVESQCTTGNSSGHFWLYVEAPFMINIVCLSEADYVDHFNKVNQVN